MNDSPVVGILAGATVDHLLVDAQLHETLCEKNPVGKVIYEVKKECIPSDQSFLDRYKLIIPLNVLNIWENSQRPCKLCTKIWKKEQQK